MVEIANTEAPDDVREALGAYGAWVNNLNTKTFIRLEEANG
jgi:hypothetical protein